MYLPWGCSFILRRSSVSWQRDGTCWSQSVLNRQADHVSRFAWNSPCLYLFLIIIINSGFFHFQKCPIWMKSYLVILSMYGHYIKDIILKILWCVWQNERANFSLSLSVFIAKFIYGINTFRVILLKWIQSCLFVAQNSSMASHITQNNNQNPCHGLQAPHDPTHFFPKPFAWPSCPHCGHSHTRVSESGDLHYLLINSVKFVDYSLKSSILLLIDRNISIIEIRRKNMKVKAQLAKTKPPIIPKTVVNIDMFKPVENFCKSLLELNWWHLLGSKIWKALKNNSL